MATEWAITFLTRDGPTTARRVSIRTYDVTELVRNGKNCLGVMLGNGMYHEDGRAILEVYRIVRPAQNDLTLADRLRRRLDVADRE